MFVPYISRDNNIDAYKKMKVLFLVKKIRRIDFCFLLLSIFPLFFNVLVFHMILGNNEVWKAFCPIGSFFKPSQASPEDWIKWHGTLHLLLFIYSFVRRIVLSLKLWDAMKKYSIKNPRFKWNRNDKFWFILYLPFVSFSVYSILRQFSKSELYHKYNL